MLSRNIGYACSSENRRQRNLFFNASSNKFKQYLENNKACIYFYKRGRFKYQGVSITGEMQVCTDQATKDEIWRFGDVLFYKQGVTDTDYRVLKFTGKTAE